MFVSIVVVLASTKNRSFKISHHCGVERLCNFATNAMPIAFEREVGQKYQRILLLRLNKIFLFLIGLVFDFSFALPYFCK